MNPPQVTPPSGPETTPPSRPQVTPLSRPETTPFSRPEITPRPQTEHRYHDCTDAAVSRETTEAVRALPFLV